LNKGQNTTKSFRDAIARMVCLGYWWNLVVKEWVTCLIKKGFLTIKGLWGFKLWP